MSVLLALLSAIVLVNNVSKIAEEVPTSSAGFRDEARSARELEKSDKSEERGTERRKIGDFLFFPSFPTPSPRRAVRACERLGRSRRRAHMHALEKVP